MNRYLYAALIATALLALQLLISAQSRLHGLSADTSELVGQVIASGISAKLLMILGGYLVIGLLAHVAPLLLTSKVHRDLLLRGPRRFRDLLARRGSHTLALIATLALMVITNHALFPASQALPNSDLLLTQPASPLLIYGLPLGCGAVFLYWLARVASIRIRLAFIVAASLTAIVWVPSSVLSESSPTSRAQPDIIVIGVDSLRPDYMRTFGYAGAALTPTIDSFVHDAVRFDNAYTPMGRTFVAYMSILSGQYPIRHGARENLYPATLIDKQASVAHRLKSAGYTTMFAMDESRFANFDQGYGFDTLVTPPPGIVDFLVADFLDTIGTNLLQLLPHSFVWMPHVAGNRAAATTYRPAAHDSRLARAITNADAKNPLFLATHYCIAHLPYVLSQDNYDFRTAYEAALHVADGQVARILAELKAAGRLDNALVVLLSDHGEALALQDDQWLMKNINTDTSDELIIGQFFGHGLPAMDEPQARVLLAIQHYRDGQPVWSSAASQQPTSLIDVVPTLLSAAAIHFDAGAFDGNALLDATGTLLPLPERPMFVESGLSGASLQKAIIDPAEVASEFGRLFELTPDYHLQLQRPELLEQLRRKQRAVLFKRYGVSSWPSGQFSERGDCWMKLDRITLFAQCLPLHTTDPVVTTYKTLLCGHFATDLEFAAHWCTTTDNGVTASESATLDNPAQ